MLVWIKQILIHSLQEIYPNKNVEIYLEIDEELVWKNLPFFFTAGIGSAQKMKPGHRLKAQTSRIVSSFKAPAVICTQSREFRGHRDGVWDVTTSRNGLPLVGSASAGIVCLKFKMVESY